MSARVFFEFSVNKFILKVGCVNNAAQIVLNVFLQMNAKAAKLVGFYY